MEIRKYQSKLTIYTYVPYSCLSRMLLNQTQDQEHLNIHVVYAVKQLRVRHRLYVVILAMFGITRNVWVCIASYTKACISWYCDLSGLPNFSSSLFDMTSFETTNGFDIFNDTPVSEGIIGSPTAASSPLDKAPKRSKVKRYDKPLRVVLIYCQSVRSKKQELESANSDIIIGNES